MWLASFYFGLFVGPTSAGIFVEAWGFKFTTLQFFVVYILSIIIDCLELFYQLRNSFKNRSQDYVSLKTLDRDCKIMEKDSLLAKY